VTRDPERMTDMVEKLVRVGVLTPEEGRLLAGDIFNREFRKLGDDWTKRPITLTLAGIQTQQTDVDAGSRRTALLDGARSIMNLRDELAAEEEQLAERRLDLARRYLAGDDVVRIEVPRDELASWFEEEAARGQR
jgi:polyhydroxyalkanoate synthesis regulator phasin